MQWWSNPSGIANGLSVSTAPALLCHLRMLMLLWWLGCRSRLCCPVRVSVCLVHLFRARVILGWPPPQGAVVPLCCALGMMWGDPWMMVAGLWMLWTLDPACNGIRWHAQLQRHNSRTTSDAWGALPLPTLGYHHCIPYNSSCRRHMVWLTAMRRRCNRGSNDGGMLGRDGGLHVWHSSTDASPATWLTNTLIGDNPV